MDRYIAISRSLLLAGLFATVACCCTKVFADVDLTGNSAPPNAIWLDSLDLSTIQQGYGSPGAGKSVDGNALKLGGITYKHGVGTHATSEYMLNLHGDATRFQSEVGVDDEKTGMGSVTFTVVVDGVKKVETPILHGGDKPVFIDVDLTGAKKLELQVGDGGDGIIFGPWRLGLVRQLLLSLAEQARRRL